MLAAVGEDSLDMPISLPSGRKFVEGNEFLRVRGRTHRHGFSITPPNGYADSFAESFVLMCDPLRASSPE